MSNSNTLTLITLEGRVGIRLFFAPCKALQLLLNEDRSAATLEDLKRAGWNLYSIETLLNPMLLQFRQRNIELEELLAKISNHSPIPWEFTGVLEMARWLKRHPKVDERISKEIRFSLPAQNPR